MGGGAGRGGGAAQRRGRAGCRTHTACGPERSAAARGRTCSSLFAPVITTLPERKMSAVVFGSRIRMITAAKRCAAGRCE